MEIPPTQDPLALFRNWLAEAKAKEPADAEAMTLATANAQGRPSARMVLLKDIGPEGFVFYTNMESKKGQDLAANPHAALCFHWKSLGRQVRVEGRVEQVDPATADAYFASRPPLSQLSAWASRQSAPLENRAALEARIEEFRNKFKDQKTPRPPHWGGWRVIPEKIEFWQEGAGRLHDRFLFTQSGEGWDLTRLNP